MVAETVMVVAVAKVMVFLQDILFMETKGEAHFTWDFLENDTCIYVIYTYTSLRVKF